MQIFKDEDKILRCLVYSLYNNHVCINSSLKEAVRIIVTENSEHSIKYLEEEFQRF